MSKSLSANITAGYNGDSNPVYLVQIEDSAGTIYYFASADFTDASIPKVYEGGRIADGGFGLVRLAVDVTKGGNIATYGDWDLKLNNGDAYSDTLATAYFENCRIELRMIFADKTLPYWSNAVTLFNGFIETLAWDDQFVYIKAAHGWKRWSSPIPARVLTKEEFPSIPQSNEGKSVPIIFGDWTEGFVNVSTPGGLNKSGIGSNVATGGGNIRHRDYFLGYLLKAMQRSGNHFGDNPRVVYACHDMYTINIGHEHLNKPIFLDTRKIWTRCTVRHSGTMLYGEDYSGLFTQSVFLLNAGNQGAYPDLIPLVDSLNTTGTTDAANAVNENFADYCTLDANGEVAGYAIPATFGTGSETLLLQLLYWIDAIDRVDDKVQYRLVAKDGAVVINWTDVGYGSLTPVTISLPAFGSARGDYSGAQIQFRYVDVGSHDSGCQLRIRVAYLRLTETIDDPSEIICDSGKGHMYGSWITSHTPSPAQNTGDLIENPVYAAESLLIDAELNGGLAAISDIAIAAFDATATSKSTWKMRAQLREQRDTFGWLKQIAFEFGFCIFERYDGKFTAQRIDSTGGSPPTLTTTAMLMTGNNTSFKIGRGDLRNIYNEFLLHYKVNVINGEAEKLMFVKNPQQSSFDAGYTNLSSGGSTYWQKCHDVYTNFKIRAVWEYTADFIRDDATAELFIKFMINLLARRPYVATFKSPLTLIGYEILDEVRLTHILLPAAMDATANFRLVSQSIDPNEDTIENTFMEVA